MFWVAGGWRGDLTKSGDAGDDLPSHWRIGRTLLPLAQQYAEFRTGVEMTPFFSRRQTLALGAGAIGVAVLGPTAALAKNDADEAIKKFTGGKTPVQGKVKLDLPEIAENGNTVPMTVTVESPMTEQSHVTDVLIVADENPRSGVVTFHFSPASGVAEANTRIRLAATQDVIAVAKMNDGSVFMTSKQVKVTIGGCGG
jgi:sulfur-oxidizing protein SoxY